MPSLLAEAFPPTKTKEEFPIYIPSSHDITSIGQTVLFVELSMSIPIALPMTDVSCIMLATMILFLFAILSHCPLETMWAAPVLYIILVLFPTRAIQFPLKLIGPVVML